MRLSEHDFAQNRLPSRIKPGAGIFGIMLQRCHHAAAAATMTSDEMRCERYSAKACGRPSPSAGAARTTGTTMFMTMLLRRCGAVTPAAASFAINLWL
jgi:hypothetical protein